MPLSALTPFEFGAIICESIVSVILFIVGFSLIKKYRDRKIGDILILASCILVFAVAPLMQMLDIVLFMDLFAPIDSGIGYTLAFSLSAYANILLLWFFLRVYVEELSKVNLIVIIYAALNIVNTTLLVHTAVYMILTTIRLERAYYLVIHLLLSLILYIYMLVKANRSSKKDIPLKSKKGFQLIAGFAVFLILAFTFFIMDSLSFTFFGVSYTPWTYIGWACGAVGSICAYLGYIMPSWLKKRWE